MNQTVNKQREPRCLTELLSADFMARLDCLDVLSRKILQGKLQGERRSKRRGQSVEFADHRPYVAGDDLRFVDWNIYGRLDQLFLKLFMEEQDLTVHIVIDTSASMRFPDTPGDVSASSKILFVKKVAAALGYISLVNNNRVTMSSFADGLTGQLARMRGRAYLPQMAEFLLNDNSQTSHNNDQGIITDFDSICRQLASMRIGKGIMIILSDFLFKEGYDSGLRRLIGRNYDLYVMQVLAPEELKPQLAGDLKLIDIEDADDAEISVSSALLKFYQRNVTAYCNELKDFCVRRGATYMLVKSSDAIEMLVLNYLQRIGLLR